MSANEFTIPVEITPAEPQANVHVESNLLPPSLPTGDHDEGNTTSTTPTYLPRESSDAAATATAPNPTPLVNPNPSGNNKRVIRKVMVLDPKKLQQAGLDRKLAEAIGRQKLKEMSHEKKKNKTQRSSSEIGNISSTIEQDSGSSSHASAEKNLTTGSMTATTRVPSNTNKQALHFVETLPQPVATSTAPLAKLPVKNEQHTVKNILLKQPESDIIVSSITHKQTSIQINNIKETKKLLIPPKITITRPVEAFASLQSMPQQRLENVKYILKCKILKKQQFVTIEAQQTNTNFPSSDATALSTSTRLFPMPLIELKSEDKDEEFIKLSTAKTPQKSVSPAKTPKEIARVLDFDANPTKAGNIYSSPNVSNESPQGTGYINYSHNVSKQSSEKIQPTAVLSPGIERLIKRIGNEEQTLTIPIPKATIKCDNLPVLLKNVIKKPVVRKDIPTKKNATSTKQDAVKLPVDKTLETLTFPYKLPSGLVIKQAPMPQMIHPQTNWEDPLAITANIKLPYKPRLETNPASTIITEVSNTGTDVSNTVIKQAPMQQIIHPQTNWEDPLAITANIKLPYKPRLETKPASTIITEVSNTGIDVSNTANSAAKQFPTTNSDFSTFQNLPLYSPLKHPFPLVTHSQDLPLPKISTFISAPFPTSLIGVQQQLEKAAQHHMKMNSAQSKSLILEDKVLTPAEKIDLTELGLATSNIESATSAKPTESSSFPQALPSQASLSQASPSQALSSLPYKTLNFGVNPVTHFTTLQSNPQTTAAASAKVTEWSAAQSAQQPPTPATPSNSKILLKYIPPAGATIKNRPVIAMDKIKLSTEQLATLVKVLNANKNNNNTTPNVSKQIFVIRNPKNIMTQQNSSKQLANEMKKDLPGSLQATSSTSEVASEPQVTASLSSRGLLINPVYTSTSFPMFASQQVSTNIVPNECAVIQAQRTFLNPTTVPSAPMPTAQAQSMFLNSMTVPSAPLPSNTQMDQYTALSQSPKTEQDTTLSQSPPKTTIVTPSSEFPTTIVPKTEIKTDLPFKNPLPQPTKNTTKQSANSSSNSSVYVADSGDESDASISAVDFIASLAADYPITEDTTLELSPEELNLNASFSKNFSPLRIPNRLRTDSSSRSEPPNEEAGCATNFNVTDTKDMVEKLYPATLTDNMQIGNIITIGADNIFNPITANTHIKQKLGLVSTTSAQQQQILQFNESSSEYLKTIKEEFISDSLDRKIEFDAVNKIAEQPQISPAFVQNLETNASKLIQVEHTNVLAHAKQEQMAHLLVKNEALTSSNLTTTDADGVNAVNEHEDEIDIAEEVITVYPVDAVLATETLTVSSVKNTVMNVVAAPSSPVSNKSAEGSHIENSGINHDCLEQTSSTAKYLENPSNKSNLTEEVTAATQPLTAAQAKIEENNDDNDEIIKFTPEETTSVATKRLENNNDNGENPKVAAEETTSFATKRLPRLKKGKINLVQRRKNAPSVQETKKEAANKEAEHLKATENVENVEKKVEQDCRKESIERKVEQDCSKEIINNPVEKIHEENTDEFRQQVKVAAEQTRTETHMVELQAENTGEFGQQVKVAAEQKSSETQMVEQVKVAAEQISFETPMEICVAPTAVSVESRSERSDLKRKIVDTSELLDPPKKKTKHECVITNTDASLNPCNSEEETKPNNLLVAAVNAAAQEPKLSPPQNPFKKPKIEESSVEKPVKGIQHLLAHLNKEKCWNKNAVTVMEQPTESEAVENNKATEDSAVIEQPREKVADVANNQTSEGSAVIEQPIEKATDTDANSKALETSSVIEQTTEKASLEKNKTTDASAVIEQPTEKVSNADENNKTITAGLYKTVDASKSERKSLQITMEEPVTTNQVQKEEVNQKGNTQKIERTCNLIEQEASPLLAEPVKETRIASNEDNERVVTSKAASVDCDIVNVNVIVKEQEKNIKDENAKTDNKQIVCKDSQDSESKPKTGFLGFEEHSPTGQNIESNLQQLVTITNSAEKTNTREENFSTAERESPHVTTDNKQQLLPTKSWLTHAANAKAKKSKDDVEYGRKSQTHRRSVPLKKRWEVLRKSEDDLEVSDDLTPVDDDDDDEEDDDEAKSNCVGTQNAKKVAVVFGSESEMTRKEGNEGIEGKEFLPEVENSTKTAMKPMVLTIDSLLEQTFDSKESKDTKQEDVDNAAEAITNISNSTDLEASNEQSRLDKEDPKLPSRKAEGESISVESTATIEPETKQENKTTHTILQNESKKQILVDKEENTEKSSAVKPKAKRGRPRKTVTNDTQQTKLKASDDEATVVNATFSINESTNSFIVVENKQDVAQESEQRPSRAINVETEETVSTTQPAELEVEAVKVVPKSRTRGRRKVKVSIEDTVVDSKLEKLNEDLSRRAEKNFETEARKEFETPATETTTTINETTPINEKTVPIKEPPTTLTEPPTSISAPAPQESNTKDQRRKRKSLAGANLDESTDDENTPIGRGKTRGRIPKALKASSTLNPIEPLCLEETKNVDNTQTNVTEAATEAKSELLGKLNESTVELETPIKVPKKRGRKPRAALTETLATPALTETSQATTMILNINTAVAEPTPDVNISVSISESTVAPETAIKVPKKRGRKPKVVMETPTAEASAFSESDLKPLPNFNARLLLINNRAQLDTDEVLTAEPKATSTSKAKNLVECGLCLEQVHRETWLDHLATHYGVGWIVGEMPEIDVSMRYEVLKNMIAFAKLNDGQYPLTCRMCKRTYRSGLGALLHIELCGATDTREKCEYCGTEYAKSSIRIHVRSCNVRLAQTHLENAGETNESQEEPVFNNVGRQKRASVKKAERILKAIGDASKTTFIMSPKDAKQYIKFVPAVDDSPAEPDEKWKSDLASLGKAHCPASDCTFETPDLTAMQTHYKECIVEHPPTRNGAYICKICAISKDRGREAIYHVLKEHRQFDEEPDFEPDASDCDIKTDDEWSDDDDDDLSSGVDSNEESDRFTSDLGTDDENYAPRRYRRRKEKVEGEKWDIHPPTSPNYSKIVMQLWREFSGQQYSTEPLFNDIQVNYNICARADYERCLPRWENSMKFKFNSKLKLSQLSTEVPFGKACTDIEWSQLQRFEQLKNNNERLIFIGEAIKFLHWVPLPSDIREQYLLVGTRREYTRMSHPKINNTLLWLYKVTSADSHTPARMQLHYAINIPDGPVHCVAFLPSGGYSAESNRLALLAVGNAKSTIKVYALPLTVATDSTQQQPQQQQKEAAPQAPEEEEAGEKCADALKDLITINLAPAWLLALDVSKNDMSAHPLVNTQCKTLCWSELSGHSYIFAGYANGCISYWDLSYEMNLNRFIIDDVPKYVPLNFIQTRKTNICAMALHYDSGGPRLLAVAASRRYLSIYDMKNMCRPLLLKEEVARNEVTTMEWSPLWESLVVGTSDAFPTTTKSLYAVNPVNIGYKNATIDTLNGAITQVHYNPTQHLLATAADNGDLVLFNMREMYQKYILSKTRERCRAVGIVDVKSLNGTDIPQLDLKAAVPADWSFYETNYKEKYGVVFGPIEKTKVAQKELYYSDKRRPPVHLVNCTRINCVRFNINLLGKKLLAAGYENGFLRVLKVDRKSYFKKEQWRKQQA